MTPGLKRKHAPAMPIDETRFQIPFEFIFLPLTFAREPSQ